MSEITFSNPSSQLAKEILHQYALEFGRHDDPSCMCSKEEYHSRVFGDFGMDYWLNANTTVTNFTYVIDWGWNHIFNNRY